MADALVKIVLQDDEATAGADRFSQALGRVERSEPTMALRRTRFAIDELTASATGLPPVLGRLVSIFAQMGIGGITGIAAVAGFAAITFEVKSLIGAADELDKKLTKLSTTLATGAESSLFKAAGFRQEAAALGPGVLNINRGFFQSLSPEALAAANIGDATQRTNLENAARQEVDKFDRDHAKKLEEHAKKLNAATLAVGEHVGALEKARLGLHGTMTLAQRNRR